MQQALNYSSIKPQWARRLALNLVLPSADIFPEQTYERIGLLCAERI